MNTDFKKPYIFFFFLQNESTQQNMKNMLYNMTKIVHHRNVRMT